MIEPGTQTFTWAHLIR